VSDERVDAAVVTGTEDAADETGDQHDGQCQDAGGERFGGAGIVAEPLR